MTKKPRVSHGQVMLSGPPTLVHRSKGCVVWEINCATKYADPVITRDDKGVQLVLNDGEGTLASNPFSDKPTVIRWSGRKFASRMVFVDGGRYSWRVCLVRDDRSD